MGQFVIPEVDAHRLQPTDIPVFAYQTPEKPVKDLRIVSKNSNTQFHLNWHAFVSAACSGLMANATLIKLLEVRTIRHPAPLMLKYVPATELLHVPEILHDIFLCWAALCGPIECALYCATIDLQQWAMR